MNTTAIRDLNLNAFLGSIKIKRGLAFGMIILAALLAFELFNYSTTEFALSDLLGSLTFLGMRWSTILALAFCGIDFAGIARLFTPEAGADEPNEVWYLFSAWLLAATMNAMLTWWGVSIAILNHASSGDAVVARETLLRVVPIFVAVMVWLIRVLIIGSFSVAGGRLFSQAERGRSVKRGLVGLSYINNPLAPKNPAAAAQAGLSQSVSLRPAPKPLPHIENAHTRPEPIYHPASMNAAEPADKSPARTRQ